MKNTPRSNASPKIIAFAQGEPAQTIILFIPDFKTEWINQIKQLPSANIKSENQQWSIPFSLENIQQLEQLFGKDILFAFRVGWLEGNHRTDKV